MHRGTDLMGLLGIDQHQTPGPHQDFLVTELYCTASVKDQQKLKHVVDMVVPVGNSIDENLKMVQLVIVYDLKLFCHPNHLPLSF